MAEPALQKLEQSGPYATLTFQSRGEQLAVIDYIKDEVMALLAQQGLTFFPQEFQIVDHHELHAIAARGGFPRRMQHWRTGMEYEQLEKSYRYGQMRISELVINHDPCHAYMLASNTPAENLLIIPHVLAHNDFFKNNLTFDRTDRSFLNRMGDHATRLERYVGLHGMEKVEVFLEACLSLDNLIDPFFQPKTRPPVEPPAWFLKQERAKEQVTKFPAKEYMDRWINPKEALAAEEKQIQQKREKVKVRFPFAPQRDVLLFLLEYAPLEDWQRDVLGMVRDESYYFDPQRRTKIMNEGWASFWHSKMMTQHLLQRYGFAVIDYADLSSRTTAMAPGRLNPYKIGLEIFRDIEERWNKGQFGKEYEECDDLSAKAHWDKKLGQGPQKVLEVRRLYNDVTFIDEFLTPELCTRLKLFVSREGTDNSGQQTQTITSRDFAKIKRLLLDQISSAAAPHLVVSDANFENRGELLLEHKHNGLDLRADWLPAVLTNLHSMWRRPVCVSTVVQEKKVIARYDGEAYGVKQL